MTDTNKTITCQCGNTCELTTTMKGDGPAVSMRPAEGWTYSAEHGWRCPECRDKQGK